MFFNRFDVLMLEIFFLKIYYFDVFSSEKYFKNQSLPHFQTLCKKKNWSKEQWYEK